MKKPDPVQIALNLACFASKLSKSFGDFKKLGHGAHEPIRSLGDAVLTHNHTPFSSAGGGRRFTHYGRLLQFHLFHPSTVLTQRVQAAFFVFSPVSRRTAHVQ
jgi:hypothetical protein